MFQYFGPMHDGVVWPLLLEPRDAPLAPTWQIASWYTGKPYAPSGDRIGEALGRGYPLADVLKLCRRLTDAWRRGADLLARIPPGTALGEECRSELSVARALALQFRSGYNILLFYSVRENLLRMICDVM